MTDHVFADTGIADIDAQFYKFSMDAHPRMGWHDVGLQVLPCLAVKVQNKRKPLRCQAMTVSGLRMTRADRESAQTPDNHAQNTRSATVNFGGLLAERPEHTDLIPQRQDSPAGGRRASARLKTV